MSALLRFIPKLQIDQETGCWIWIGARNAKGYGRFGLNGRNRLAYAVAYELIVGPIPNDGLVFDHLCENKSCVNPQHLQRVTNGENVARGLERVCRNGHPKGYRGRCRVCVAANERRKSLRRAAPSTR